MKLVDLLVPRRSSILCSEVSSHAIRASFHLTHCVRARKQTSLRSAYPYSERIRSAVATLMTHHNHSSLALGASPERGKLNAYKQGSKRAMKPMKDILTTLYRLITLFAWIFTLWGVANLIVSCQGPPKPYDYNSPEHIEATQWLDSKEELAL